MRNEKHAHEHHHEGRRAWRRAHYEQEDTNGKLVINLRDLGHTLRALSEGRGSQKRILTVLLETGPITQRELTQRLGIQPGSASEVIAKLENAGLVTRKESEEDRRTADIALTEEGERQAEEAKAQRAGRHGEMFAVLTEEEKAQLLALLEKVNQDWERRFADKWGERCPSHGEKGHGPHDRHGQHGFHEEMEGPRHRGEGEGRPQGEDGGRRGCNHDCANCPNPCGRGRALRESGR